MVYVLRFFVRGIMKKILSCFILFAFSFIQGRTVPPGSVLSLINEKGMPQITREQQDGNTYDLLNLSEKELDSLQGIDTISGIKDAEHLIIELDNNQLSLDEIYRLNDISNIEGLDLSGNRLNGEITKEHFKDLKNLNFLVLGGNKISGIADGAFEQQAHLKDLVVGDSLTKITAGMFKGLVSLEELDLSFSKIEKIDINAFKDCVKLEKLDLSKNEIKELGKGVFSGLGALKSLDLSHNYALQVVNTEGLNFESLETLRLDSLRKKIEGPEVYLTLIIKGTKILL